MAQSSQLPVPVDPDDHREMWITVQVVSALARANENTFVMLLILLVLYVAGRLALAAATYLFQLYKARAFTPNPQQHTFRIALMIGGCFAFLGVLALFSPDSQGAGWLVLIYVFAAFSCVSAFLDWYFSRTQQLPTLEGVTADDVLEWQGEVDDGYEMGVLPRGAR